MSLTPHEIATAWHTDIGSVKIGQTLLLDGWGIHLSIQGGFTEFRNDVIQVPLAED